MRITGEDLLPFIFGAVENVPGPSGGIAPRRLPESARLRHGDLMFELLSRTPAGVRLRVSSESGFDLELTTTTVETPDGPPRGGILAWHGPTGRHTADLGTGEVIVLNEHWQPIDRREAQPVKAEIEPGAVEIWLPHDRSVEILSLQGEGITPAADERPMWVHYGSSISHGLEKEAADETWPAQVARAQDWALHNFSFAANAKLDPFVADAIAAVPADLITLKVGINIVVSDDMRERTLRPLWHAFLDTIRRAQPDTPIIVITPIACPALETSPGPLITTEGAARPARRDVEQDAGALTLEDARRVAREVVAAREDANLHLIEGTDLFGAGDAARLYDGLHPDPEGLDLIAERFLTVFAGTPPAQRGSLGQRR